MRQKLRRLAVPFAFVILAATSGALAQQAQLERAAQALPPLNAQDVIPFDAAVRTATLPNGVKVFIRQNGQPAKRVALRLAIKAGSIHEADDQQGLAHVVE